MNQVEVFSNKLSGWLDRIAGLFMVALMTLVVANIIFKNIFNNPILGTYEYVGLLTAVIISFALANCAVRNSHIAVGFVVDRFPQRIQGMVDVCVNSIALLFWLLTTWHISKYAQSVASSGMVSQTTQLPYYPFIYMVALGLLALCLVLLAKLIESIKKAAL